ncbi:MAG: DMT family transporter [Bradyrhizobium sp.]|uniref:DMT family transporter n=1 Tax=Bradyrhizobium sp. TaxID=376 RepID=UPI0027283DDA|nr:DMT family transporter [Bradyrhizobium sp.]MDO9560047.1 DMT family transporter [Bradyrhizobium sp.]MDP3690922.1 DMT family transporter [Bradyrhizobium sp.]
MSLNATYLRRVYSRCTGEERGTARSSHLPTPRTIGLTILAMLAFAANSVLCRLALDQGSIDPASFTLVRIGSGVVALWLILACTGRTSLMQGSWRGAFALVAYAAAFSFAYLTLSAGAGSLLLFGAVQATMVTTGLVRGERLTAPQWLGFAVALAGLAVLLMPGAAAPPIGGALLMFAAGIAWGAYSLIGRGAIDPLAATAGNFLRALPLAAILLGLTAMFGTKLDQSGLVYAIASGAVASGLGYTIWYAALPGLSQARGASVQMSVPVITALAGTLVLGETITLRLSLSSAAILGGIALVIASRPRAP